MPSIRYWVWLSAVTEVRPAARAALIAHYGDAEQAFLAPPGAFESVPGLTAREAAALERRDLGAADAALCACREQDIRIITMQDAAYPRRLKNIFAPPVVLYVKGRLPDVDATPSVAVIGTRGATPYGLKMGMNLSFEMAKEGAVIVSGLTEGIDRAAAKGCLLAGGVCIGVLGTAHGRESALQRDVIAAGALVSEYPPGTEGRNHFFRERNRISAGLSHAVVVVEAPEKSGSLLFAQEALEQGREIFAVPGNADAVNSVGTIALLKQGARPCSCGWDVLEELAQVYPDRLRRAEELVLPPEQAALESPQSTPKAAAPSAPEEKKAVDKPPRADYIDLRDQLSALSEEQLKIITAIDRGQTHIDDIIENTGLSAAKVLSQLTILEIKGYIRRTAGRQVSLNIKAK